MKADEIVRVLRDAEGNNELDCEISELRPLLLKAAALIESLQVQPDNKPLTLDELGQLREAQIPIWMGRAKEWIFVASVADAPYAQVWYFNAKGFAQTVLYHHETFYRSKPKEE